MARCAKCGKMSGVPDEIKLKDMRTGTMKPVRTMADLLGNKPSLRDQTDMNKRNLRVKNPINGKM